MTVDIELEKGGKFDDVDTWDKITISDGDIKDMKAEDGYTKYVQVIESDDEYAELVYIYSVDVEANEPDEPEEKPEYDLHAWAGSTKGNVQIAIVKHTYNKEGVLTNDEWLTVDDLDELDISVKDISMKTAGQTFEPVTEDGFPIALNILDYTAVHGDGQDTNAALKGAGFLKVHFAQGSVVIGARATITIDGIGSCTLTY